MKIKTILTLTILSLLLGFALYAGGNLAIRFFYFVLALHWFMHIIGTFILAGVVVYVIYWIGKELGFFE